jgi:hypothetical protein
MAGALAEAPTGANEEEDDGKLTPDSPRLFEMPAVVIDESNPTQITVAFSGSVTLDRSQASDVALYNQLKHGKVFDLNVSGLVKGSRKTHRRDNDGNVDAIAETKTLVVDSITVDE